MRSQLPATSLDWPGLIRDIPAIHRLGVSSKRIVWLSYPGAPGAGLLSNNPWQTTKGTVYPTGSAGPLPSRSIAMEGLLPCGACRPVSAPW